MYLNVAKPKFGSVYISDPTKRGRGIFQNGIFQNHSFPQNRNLSEWNLSENIFRPNWNLSEGIIQKTFFAKPEPLRMESFRRNLSETTF
jgi:hypothetical protein